MNNLVIMKEQQAVTSSLQIAESFERNHRDVLKAVDDLKEGLAEKYADLFWEDTYTHPQNKQKYRVIYMNRDGFTLSVLGFSNTKRVLEFKLKYIEAFNQMENHIKRQLDASQLSPELQILNQMIQSMAKQELETKRLESKVDGISNLIAMDSKDWRTEAVAILRKIASKQGGHNQYKEVANDSYIRLEYKARCNLNIRLENRRKNMIAQGLGKTAVKKLNRLDIIEEDHRLKQIYMQVIKDMAIKYGVWEGA